MGHSHHTSCSKEDDLANFINQLDGNISLESSFLSSHDSLVDPNDLNTSSAYPELYSLSDSESDSFTEESYDDCDRQHIPTQVGYRPMRVHIERPPASWRTIRRNNKAVQALTLPVISNYNMRSFLPKIHRGLLRQRNQRVKFLGTYQVS